MVKKKRCSRCGKPKSLSAFGVRASSGDGRQGKCLKCTRKYFQVYRTVNREDIRERARREREEKPDQVRARQKRYRDKHPDRSTEPRKPYAERKEYYRERYQRKKAEIRLQHKAYYRINKNTIAEYHKKRYIQKRGIIKQYKAKWDHENRDKCRAQWMARAARKRQAMPAWANVDKIRDIYREAENRSRVTGTPYHVDHIIPLRHKLVCGLHCEGNLQVLTQKENQEKLNKFEPIFISVSTLP